MPRPAPAPARDLIELILDYGLIVFIRGIVLAIVSVLIAKQIGTLHALYQNDVKHAAGYVLWTLYQQFLLNDLFMPRLTRLLSSENAAVGLSAVLSFALLRMTREWEATHSLLRDSGLITHRQPVPRATHPDSRIAIRTAEVFSKLVTLYVSPRRDHGHVAVDAHHHVAHVDSVIAKLPALAS
jgi:hypothetical protein